MTIPEELLPVVEWWEKDGKKTLAIAAVVGVVALAYCGWTARQERLRDAAADALSAAVDASVQVQFDAKGTGALKAIEDVKAAVASFGDSKSGPMLKLMLATDYFARKDEGDVAAALEIYESLSKDAVLPAVYKDIPAVGRAQCLEALGRYDEALEAFDAFAEANPESTLALTAKLGAARALAQAGKKADAIARLEALKAEKTADVGAVEFTLSLVKRWVPAANRVPAPVVAPAPAAETPAPAPAAETPAPAPAEAAPEAK